ncbi:peptidoglycan recognition protein family protein [Streptomyces sp. DT24]|uniref:peptidoglycan recognition protein family protein n=1 Tax=unclassified Streptomyces TaxID=2593676 RepID=UPI0023B91C20|nr:peptidoglycan recognition protein [Streptomyces sp. AM 4-1-1]WEH34761.1 peptidoglycan recognition protein [Streptomyces sp. AM 4-1-1]
MALALAFLVLRDAPVRFALPEAVGSSPERPPAAPEPRIVSRHAWRADESLVRERAVYTGAVNAVFIHHTGHPNGYDCADVPDMLRAMEVEHVKSQGWDDIGYNFVVDRCGTIYEGRAGGVERSVRGAHTKGFNADSVGIAALGTFGPGTKVPRPLLEGIAKVAAWKLRPGADPGGKVRLVSSSDESKYDKGRAVELHVISGHRDSYQTVCPGDALYDRLPEVRQMVARLRRH